MLYHYGSDVFPCLHETKKQALVGSAAVQPVLSISRKQIQKGQGSSMCLGLCTAPLQLNQLVFQDLTIPGKSCDRTCFDSLTLTKKRLSRLRLGGILACKTKARSQMIAPYCKIQARESAGDKATVVCCRTQLPNQYICNRYH